MLIEQAQLHVQKAESDLTAKAQQNVKQVESNSTSRAEEVAEGIRAEEQQKWEKQSDKQPCMLKRYMMKRLNISQPRHKQ